ncbi:hypothetical protein [Wenyingzhuangia sp. IMCC45574]
MQKKLEAELMSLAHKILKMDKGDDIQALTDTARNLYQKLSVLAYIDTFVKETPQNTKSVEELIDETFNTNIPVENVITKEPDVVAEQDEVEEFVEAKKEAPQEIIEETPKDLEALSNAFTPIATKEEQPKAVIEQTEEFVEDSEPLVVEKELVKENVVANKELNLQASLEKELGTTVSLDMTTDLFENAQRITPKKSINDMAMQQKSLQIGLNDRIAFVKHLFEGSQEDFNRVVSQLNTMENEKEALSFLKMIKKEYNWSGKEVYEERLLLLIERKFN